MFFDSINAMVCFFHVGECANCFNELQCYKDAFRKRLKHFFKLK